jgi:hypothetical protein
MSSSVGADVALSVVVGGLIFLVAIVLQGGRGESVASRVSAYVTPTPELAAAADPKRSLVERALGDKQARQIARSPWIVRLRVEMEVADLKFGPERLFLIVLAATVIVAWLVATSTKSLP